MEAWTNSIVRLFAAADRRARSRYAAVRSTAVVENPRAASSSECRPTPQQRSRIRAAGCTPSIFTIASTSSLVASPQRSSVNRNGAIASQNRSSSNQCAGISGFPFAKPVSSQTQQRGESSDVADAASVGALPLPLSDATQVGRAVRPILMNQPTLMYDGPTIEATLQQQGHPGAFHP